MNSANKIKALENRIADLELVVDYSEDGLHLLDKDGTTILINRFCQTNEGLVFDEIKNKTMKQLEAEGVLSDSVTVKVLERKKTVSLMQHVKNGKDMLVTGTPIFNEAGEIYRVMVNSRDITELNRVKKELLKTRVLYKEAKSMLLETDTNKGIPPYIICKSPVMKKILQTAAIVAKVDSNVLITGESGTGKGVISRFIHDKSKRAQKPYVKIDCGSIPEALFESELFGYERGAFTGASNKGKIGLMELADGGTLFLDEIGELPLNCQAKLLRAMQEKEFIRIGGNKTIKVDLRIISATNRNLLKMVEEGNFREDLYYRMNVMPIGIPPLRERREDIPDLIHSFVEQLCKKYDFQRRFCMEAIDVLIDCPWKGNIRELENLVERIIIISEKSVIGVEDLPSSVQMQAVRWEQTHPVGTLADRINAFEKWILSDLLAKGETPVSMAKELSIDVTTVRRKLQKHGLPSY